MNSRSLAYDVLSRLKNEILSLKYPPGAILRERSLAQKYSVSRTPIREALQCLAQDGWVNINARRNIQVRLPSFEDMHSLFAARRALEIDVVEQIVTAGISNELTQPLNEAIERMNAAKGDLFSFITQDQDFHSMFYYALNNRYMEKFWYSVSEDMIWFGMLAMDSERYDAVLLEHRKIVSALERGCKRQIRQSVIEHLDITEQMLTERCSKDAPMMRIGQG